MTINPLEFKGIVADVHEIKSNIPAYIAPAAPTIVHNINVMGYADFMFRDCLNRLIQFERKQADELLGKVSAVEEQLQREIKVADETNLIIQGIIAPAPKGCYTFDSAREGKLYYRKGTWKYNYNALQSWFWSLEKAGVTVICVPNEEAVAAALVAYYYNSQNPSHTTLKRYIKIKPDSAFTIDPNVLTLMGVEGVNIGEVLAKRLIAIFGTPYKVFTADLDDLAHVDGLSYPSATKFLKAIGRTV